ncbi:MAG: DegV family EDD domain-containing protein [Lachnospiraceae bacterium]|nr:DegV family EDD domain-containing protein [Lachnospiraceae bacterium]
MKYIKRLKKIITDPEIDFRERQFLLLSLTSCLAVFIVFIGDLLIGEYAGELIILGITICLTPIIAGISLYFHKVRFGSILVSAWIVFVVMPGTYYFGGGFYGGSLIWFAFSSVFIGLILTGVIRKVMISILCLVAISEYLLSYYKIINIPSHSVWSYYVDSVVSVIVVIFTISILVNFQGQLLLKENKRAKEQAQKVDEMNKAQNRFFSSMSHEIRTPINTIIGLNEIILRQKDVSDEVVADAKKMQGAGKMLLAIINDILDMSKIESGQMDIVPVPYNIGGMLSDIVNMIWARANEKGLKFRVNVDPDTPAQLFGDEVRIKQVLVNILNNAVKYTKEGSVTLYIESDRISVNQVLLTLSVSDTGMGIKKDALPHLFEAFKRVDEEKNRNIEGTGLGLSIVKQIVDLMDGEISVNSVYTQGSTFTVRLKQDIVDPEAIGEIDFSSNAKLYERTVYRQSFEAPDANILIVDDNELNLDVETKLLKDTKIAIDTAPGGAEALVATLNKRYDVILMDHLMPEMDGIECLHVIRDQEGGLNRNTPVIVLTANAGSENQELYRQSGFDDYLVKPVSGDSLESMLVKHIPSEKVFMTDLSSISADMQHAHRYIRKTSILVTTDSVCDLPQNIVRKLHIPIVSYRVTTENGVFLDNTETNAREVIGYMESGNRLISSDAPSTKVYERFFADRLNEAQQILHITMAKNTSAGYENARAAASVFDNVTVVDSGHLSCGMGLMVLAAYRMASENRPLDVILEQLEKIKNKVESGFIVNDTEYLRRMGRLSDPIHNISKTLLLHPVIRLKNSGMHVKGIYNGNMDKCIYQYILKTLRYSAGIDNDVLFVAHVGMNESELDKICDMIKERYYFKNIICVQVSSAISLNAGPGTFGLLFMNKTDESYNIAGFMPQRHDGKDKDSAEEVYEQALNKNEHENPDNDPGYNTINTDKKWYEELKTVDYNEGIRHSGSEDGYKTTLEIYAEGYTKAYRDIQKYYENKDWSSYAIKVHALKSSSRIIGADKLGELAQTLEDAGKSCDEEYIMEHNEELLNGYTLIYNEVQQVIHQGDETLAEADIEESLEDNRPFADSFVIEYTYDALTKAAENKDIDTVEDVLKEVEGYRFISDDDEKIKSIKECADNFDYAGILKVLSAKDD